MAAATQRPLLPLHATRLHEHLDLFVLPHGQAAAPRRACAQHEQSGAGRRATKHPLQAAHWHVLRDAAGLRQAEARPMAQQFHHAAAHRTRRCRIAGEAPAGTAGPACAGHPPHPPRCAAYAARPAAPAPAAAAAPACRPASTPRPLGRLAAWLPDRVPARRPRCPPGLRPQLPQVRWWPHHRRRQLPSLPPQAQNLAADGRAGGSSRAWMQSRHRPWA